MLRQSERWKNGINKQRGRGSLKRVINEVSDVEYERGAAPRREGGCSHFSNQVILIVASYKKQKGLHCLVNQ